MRCHNCGGELSRVVTDLPFKVSQASIVILKDLPVWQCQNCPEYLIEDAVMEQVEQLLARAEESVELKIVKYAA